MEREGETCSEELKKENAFHWDLGRSTESGLVGIGRGGAAVAGGGGEEEGRVRGGAGGRHGLNFVLNGVRVRIWGGCGL